VTRGARPTPHPCCCFTAAVRHGTRGPARRAIALDQRGHGDSDWSPDGDYSRSIYADDVIDVSRALSSAPVLVGASLGGISSLLAIHRDSDDRSLAGADSRVVPLASALVLVDIATRMEPAGIERIFAFMRAKPDGFASLEEAADAISAYNPHRPRPKDLSGLAKNLRHGEDGRWRWHWDPAFMASRDPAEPPRQHHEADVAAESLRIPTLLVRGRMSDILSEEGVRIFLEQVPHAKYADITDAGHMVAGDRNDLFCNAVLEFLEAEFATP
jgi:pimeloyl-ACP methyl ester carboxylesterase